jgi:hypothetical protein
VTDYRILVTGSREFTDYVMLQGAIEREVWVDGACWQHPLPDTIVVVTGGARGADALAERVVHELDALPGRLHVVAEVHLADWASYGKAAGAIRNQENVDRGAAACLAFFCDGAANRGTLDCVERALKAGIPVRRYTQADHTVV